jgi:hypothetical protein
MGAEHLSNCAFCLLQCIVSCRLAANALLQQKHMNTRVHQICRLQDAKQPADPSFVAQTDSS